MADVAQFTEVIRFQYPTKGSLTSGGSSEEYATFLTTKASAVKKDGFRSFENGADNIIRVYEFVCYYRKMLEDTFDKDVRILYDGLSYRLESWELFEDGGYYYRIKASSIE